MLNAIIVDDEYSGVETLKILLSKNCPEVLVVGIADSVASAEVSVAAMLPDIVFLDVEMPYANGFELLRKLKDIDFEVVFTTAYDHYAISAIKHNAIDYLLKPINPDELRSAVKKCLERKKNKIRPGINVDAFFSALERSSQSKKIPVVSLNGIVYIDPATIIRMEADSKYTNVCLAGNKILTTAKGLGEYEAMLKEMNFFRVHKTYLVNLNHVVQYVKGEGGFVIMSDGAVVEVSRNKKAELLTNKIQKLPVPTQEGITYLETENVLRLEADGNYTTIYLEDGQKFVTSRTLKEYEEMLPTRVFFRIHKTNLVNFNHIKQYIKGEGGEVLMSDGSVLEVSRYKKAELLALLSP